jgi:hypothetical protein
MIRRKNNEWILISNIFFALSDAGKNFVCLFVSPRDENGKNDESFLQKISIRNNLRDTYVFAIQY